MESKNIVIFLCAFGVSVVLYAKFHHPIKEKEKESNLFSVDDYVPPFIDIRADFYVASKYKVMACAIRKSMAQLTENTMCFLNDADKFMFGGHTFNETWISDRACPHSEPTFRKPSEELLKDPEFQRFAFIRDPFERFVSLFLDKCIRENHCWNCLDDMRCVVKSIYDNLMFFKNRTDLHPKADYNVLHSAPISWNCHFNEDLAKWKFIVMGADSNQRTTAELELTQLLRSQGVEQDLLEELKKDISTSETLHSTHTTDWRVRAEQQVKTDVYVRDYLHKIYFFDYLIFPLSRENLDEKYRNVFLEDFYPEKH